MGSTSGATKQHEFITDHQKLPPIGTNRLASRYGDEQVAERYHGRGELGSADSDARIAAKAAQPERTKIFQPIQAVRFLRRASESAVHLPEAG